MNISALKQPSRRVDRGILPAHRTGALRRVKNLRKKGFSRKFLAGILTGFGSTITYSLSGALPGLSEAHPWERVSK